jgi:hypothetical protein
MDGEVTTRVIRCTESNAGAFRGLVAGWPELKALVLDLQAQDLFPGLRGMHVTLAGAPAWVAKGLAAIGQQNATVADGEAHAD